MKECLLCRSAYVSVFANLDRRYWRCRDCRLTFVEPSQRPGRDEERDEYLLHENSVDDPGYRAFLNQVLDPLIARIGRYHRTALDYGSGPGPAMQAMLREAGIETAVYDPFFAPNTAVLERTYDVITCTEAAEHFHDPMREFERLAGMLAPRGILAVMTSLLEAATDFASWHYRRDRTHVCFYSDATMQFLADHFGWKYERISPRVHFFLAQDA